MKNIHLIQTDKPSRLWTNNLKRRLELDEFPYQHQTGIAKNIYITNDEEIKEGDWVINLNSPYAHKELCKIDNQLELERYAQKIGNDCKKIVLTTDQDLIAYGVQPIPDEFLEWFVKNPSCKSVVIHTLMHKNHFGFNEHKIDYKIIIPKEEQKQKVICTNDVCQGECGSCNFMTLVNVEEPKQETLEEAAEKYRDYWLETRGLTLTDTFIAGAKWQQEQNNKMYSEEDLKLAYSEGQVSIINKSYTRTEQWFEHFKK
jgi:hypothetical protein